MLELLAIPGVRPPIFHLIPTPPYEHHLTPTSEYPNRTLIWAGTTRLSPTSFDVNTAHVPFDSKQVRNSEWLNRLEYTFIRNTRYKNVETLYPFIKS